MARRVERGLLGQLLLGDLAYLHTKGAVFCVDDPRTEQPRADRFEISPTGPIPGSRCRLAEGQLGRAEAEALARRGVDQEDFRRVGALKVKGARRPLRFQMEAADLAAGCDDRGEYLQLCFTASPGCYATVALREIMKTG